MKTDEIDATILQAKAFLNAYSPPREPSTDEFLKKSKSRLNRLRDILEEDSALFWPDAPPGLYLDKNGIPMQKGFHSKKK